MRSIRLRVVDYTTNSQSRQGSIYTSPIGFFFRATGGSVRITILLGGVSNLVPSTRFLTYDQSDKKKGYRGLTAGIGVLLC